MELAAEALFSILPRLSRSSSQIRGRLAVYNRGMHRRQFLQTAAALPAFAGAAALAAKTSHRVMAQDKGHVAILDPSGSVDWSWENGTVAHDIHLLKNGNVLAPTARNIIVEVTPEKEVIWQWESKAVAPFDGNVEIHGFERLDSGLTMIAETGNKRIIEVDRAGKIQSEVKLQIEKPHPHRDTRLVRKTPQGTYLVPQEGDGLVREYDKDSKIVWEYRMVLTGPETPTHQGHGIHVYSAYRLPNGNTMIGGGNNNRVLEVNPKGDIVWSVENEELPGIKFSWITQLHILANGNVSITNTHAAGKYPQLIEVNRKKEVVWSFLNWETFGNDLCANMLLDVGADVIR